MKLSTAVLTVGILTGIGGLCWSDHGSFQYSNIFEQRAKESRVIGTYKALNNCAMNARDSAQAQKMYAEAQAYKAAHPKEFEQLETELRPSEEKLLNALYVAGAGAILTVGGLMGSLLSRDKKFRVEDCIL
jgi:O6-methylguanine-DNA--protein-cysteine methyltransferase